MRIAEAGSQAFGKSGWCKIAYKSHMTLRVGQMFVWDGLELLVDDKIQGGLHDPKIWGRYALVEAQHALLLQNLVDNLRNGDARSTFVKLESSLDKPDRVGHRHCRETFFFYMNTRVGTTHKQLSLKMLNNLKYLLRTLSKCAWWNGPGPWSAQKTPSNWRRCKSRWHLEQTGVQWIYFISI